MTTSSTITGSPIREFVEMYLDGKYKQLKKLGALSIVREMIERTMWIKIWSEVKEFELAVPPETLVHNLPFLNPGEKIALCNIVAKQSYYRTKTHGTIFFHRGEIYVTNRYEYYDKVTGKVARPNELSKFHITAQDVHGIELYSSFNMNGSVVKTMSSKMRMLCVLYKDANEYIIDELALLKDIPERPQGSTQYLPRINYKNVPILKFS